MASFLVIRGQDHGRQFVIRGERVTIGRDSNNQIRLSDTEVSRQHAELVQASDGNYALRDCGSSNGTFVNSNAVESIALHSGDRIQLGRTLLIFTGDPESPSAHEFSPVEIVTAHSEDVDRILSRAESCIFKFDGILPQGGSTSAPGATTATRTVDLNDGEIFYRVSQAINRTLDIDELLGEVLDLIFQWIQCDRGCIMLIHEIDGELHPASSRHRQRSKRIHNRPIQISRTILDQVMQKREGVLTSNAQEDSRWETVASIAGLGIREAICVPMQGRYGVHGAIYIDTEISAGKYVERNRESTFDASHLKLMIAIAGQAALAVEDTQFYRAMLQSERLATMGQTIADVSHHVKNILQGISGGNYLVEDGLTKGKLDVVQKGWAIVKRNQDRISSLVMDMLSFSKDRELNLISEDVNDVVHEVVESMQSFAKSVNVSLSARLLDSACDVPMDREAIHRALLNVITNAIDAAAACEEDRRDGPAVQVMVQLNTSDQIISIQVQDNGEGIPDDQLARIFAPFQSTKGSRGTGLGLPISQKILREHRGDLTVRSKLGKGATFVLSWPIGTVASPPTLLD